MKTIIYSSVTVYVATILTCCTRVSLAFSPCSSLVERRCCDHEASHLRVPNTGYHLPTSRRPPDNRDCKRLTSTTLHTKSSNKDIKPEVTGVTLKMAFDASPSWGVAETSPTSERFTSPASLDMVHRLRRESSAVLVGRTTVQQDNCSLTVRRVDMEGEQPVRVVLDPRLSLLKDVESFAVFHDGFRTIVYHAVPEFERGDYTEMNDEACNAVTFVEMKQDLVSDTSEDMTEQYTLSPADIIQDLSSRGLNHIMVEGGPTTARLFLDAKLVDRAILCRAPIEFKVPIPAGFNEEKLKNAGLVMIGTGTMDGDTIEYWVKDGTEWPSDELVSWP